MQINNAKDIDPILVDEVFLREENDPYKNL
jgi:hypothetical protein